MLKRTLILLLVLLALLSVGCARRFAVKPLQLGSAQDLGEAERITVLTFRVDPVLYLSEMREAKKGGEKLNSWAVLMIDSQGKEHFFWATDLGFVKVNGELVLRATIPLSLKEITGNRFTLLDHEGKRAYNLKGDELRLKSSIKKIKPEDYQKFMEVIDPANPSIKEVLKGSPEYEDIVRLYREAGLRVDAIAEKASQKKFGKTLTSCSSEELRAIEKECGLPNRFLEWLLDLKIFWTAAMRTPGDFFMSVGIAKLITLGSIFQEKYDYPGYGDRRNLSAREVSEIAYFAAQEFSPNAAAVSKEASQQSAPRPIQTEQSFLEDLQMDIKAQSGKEVPLNELRKQIEEKTGKPLSELLRSGQATRVIINFKTKKTQ